MKYFLTIAASDTSGGAGIQQDIKIAKELGYWPLSAITGITVQNFDKVFSVSPISPDLLKQQIEICLSSFKVDAIKIGAICNKENINVIAESLEKYQIKTIVIDTVLASTSGASFITENSLSIFKNRLFPLANLITPNKIEFEILTNSTFNTIDDAIEIAVKYSKIWNTNILLKGGHFDTPDICEALVFKTGEFYKYSRHRLNFNYSHGTGCTLSTALACYIDKTESIETAYNPASEFLTYKYKEYNNII